MLRKLRRLLGFGQKQDDSQPQPVLQEYFCRLALEEIGISGGEIVVDHHNGICVHSDLGKLPLVFPQSYIDRVNAISKEKTTDFFFRGVISPQRSWLNEYDNVSESFYGRNPDQKYQFHEDYFRGLCASRFGLAPVGDCPWSYRFFEAILSKAIPVLGDKDHDVFAEPFTFFRHSSEKNYDALVCEQNYTEFLNRHTLKGLGF